MKRRKLALLMALTMVFTSISPGSLVGYAEEFAVEEILEEEISAEPADETGYDAEADAEEPDIQLASDQEILIGTAEEPQDPAGDLTVTETGAEEIPEVQIEEIIVEEPEVQEQPASEPESDTPADPEDESEPEFFAVEELQSEMGLQDLTGAQAQMVDLESLEDAASEHPLKDPGSIVIEPEESYYYILFEPENSGDYVFSIKDDVYIGYIEIRDTDVLNDTVDIVSVSTSEDQKSVVSLEQGKSYVIIIYWPEEEIPERSFTLEVKQSSVLSSVQFAGENRSVIKAELRDYLSSIPVDVTYENGETERVSQWVIRNDIYNYETEKWHYVMSVITEGGNTLNFKVLDKDDQEILPEDYMRGQTNIPAGTYTLELSADHGSVTPARMTLEVTDNPAITGISMDAASSCSIADIMSGSFAEEAGISVSVTYNNGENESIPGYLWEQECEPVDEKDYGYLYYSTQWGERIILQLEDQSDTMKNLCKDYGVIPAGELKLHVFSESDHTVSVTENLTITGIPENTVSLEVGREVPYELDREKKLWISFAPKKGNYYIKAKHISGGSTVIPVIQSADEGYQYIQGFRDGTDIQASGDVTYYLCVIASSDMEDDEMYKGTISCAEKKEVQSIKLVSEKKTMFLLDWEKELKSFPVKVTYQDTSYEIVDDWTTEWDCLTSVTDSGTALEMKLIQNNEPVEVGGEPEDLSLSMGECTLTVSCRNQEEISDTLQLEMVGPETTELLESDGSLANGGLHPVSCAKGESRYFRIAPNENTAGMYTISSTSTEEDSDTYVTLYKVENGQIKQIDENDDGNDDCQFKLTCYLDAGYEYFYKVEGLYGSAADFTVHFGKTLLVDQIGFEPGYPTTGVTTEIDKMISKCQIKVSYADGTNEILPPRDSKWDYSWGINTFYSELKNGDRIELLMINSEEVPVSIAYDAVIPAGQYTLKACCCLEDDLSDEIKVNMTIPEAEVLAEADSPLRISCPTGESRYFKIVPDENTAGQYSICSEDDVSMTLYELQDGLLELLAKQGSKDGRMNWNLEQGHVYYYRIDGRQEAYTLYFEKAPDVKEIKFAEDARRKFAEGLDMIANGSLYVDITYENGKTERAVANDYTQYGIYIDLYEVSDKFDLWSTLEKGSYTLEARLSGTEIKATLPIDVVSKEEASAGKAFTEKDSINLGTADGYYQCAEFTPGESGDYVFTADHHMSMKLYKKNGEEVSVVRNNHASYGAEVQAGQTYIVAVRAYQIDESDTTVTLQLRKPSSIKSVTVVSEKDTYIKKAYYLMTTYIFSVNVTYEDGFTNTVKGCNNKDIFGNGFCYKIQNQETGEITIFDEEMEFELDPGTYLLTAVHSKDSSIVSQNTVKFIVTDGDHVHTWSGWKVQKAATCTEDGVRYRSCEADGCNAVETEIIPATGHSYDGTTQTDPATSTQDGEEYQICQVCEYKDVIRVLVRKEEQDKIDAVSEKIISSEATAEELVKDVTAIDKQAVINSGSMSLVEQLEEKLTTGDTVVGTNNSKIGQAQVDTTDGAIADVEIKGAAVTVAQAVLDESNSIGSEQGVTYYPQISVKEDTENTTDTNYCLDISLNIVKGDGTPVSEKHQLAAPVTITIPVPQQFDMVDFSLYHIVDRNKVLIHYDLIVGENGEKKITFSTPSLSPFMLEPDRCKDGQHVIDETAWKETKAPSCHEVGEKETTCSRCLQTVTGVIPMTDHTWSDWEVETPATCITEGTEVRHCVNEGCTKTDRQSIAKTDHNWEPKTVSETCGKDGKRYEECSVCHATRNESVLSANGNHSWKTVVDKAATCGASGSQHRECTVCGEKEAPKAIPATKNHSWKTVTDKAATCGASGSQHRECTVCGEKEAPTAISATGNHSWKTVADKAATCGAAGSQHEECTVCHEKKAAAAIPATGSHKYGNFKVTKEATALAAGEKTRTCSVCGHKDTAEVEKLAATIKVNVKSLKLKVKQSTTAVKVIGLAAGDGIKSWKSSNTKIVKVSSKGKITAQNKAGKATVTVTLKSGKTARITVTVQKTTVKTEKISGLPKSVSLKKGKKTTLKPVLAPLTSQEKITYSTSDKKVATVSSKGVITAKKKGTAKITVKSGKKKVVVKVTVK